VEERQLIITGDLRVSRSSGSRTTKIRINMAEGNARLEEEKMGEVLPGASKSVAGRIEVKGELK